jgi:hypothetical protein
VSDSEFARIDVREGSDGDGYYTAVYRNGEPGPRSEGYAGGVRAAMAAAERDFPGVPINVVTDEEAGK